MANHPTTPETHEDYKYTLTPAEDNTTEQLNRARLRLIINKPAPLNDIRKTCTHKTSVVCVEERSDKNIMAAEKTPCTVPTGNSGGGGCDAEVCGGLKQLMLVNKIKGEQEGRNKAFVRLSWPENSDPSGTL